MNHEIASAIAFGIAILSLGGLFFIAAYTLKWLYRDE